MCGPRFEVQSYCQRSPKENTRIIDGITFDSVFRTKFKTHHDVIPISCLTEFPNVVQMAKVRGDIHTPAASPHVLSPSL